jgi:hypothetical protein
MPTLTSSRARPNSPAARCSCSGIGCTFHVISQAGWPTRGRSNSPYSDREINQRAGRGRTQGRHRRSPVGLGAGSRRLLSSRCLPYDPFAPWARSRPMLGTARATGPAVSATVVARIPGSSWRAGAGSRGRWVPMAAGMGALLVVYAGWQLFRWPAVDRRLIGDLFFYPVGLAASWAALGASRRCANQLSGVVMDDHGGVTGFDDVGW